MKRADETLSANSLLLRVMPAKHTILLPSYPSHPLSTLTGGSIPEFRGALDS